MFKLKLKRARNKQWYFVIVARNGRIIATSETYKRKSSAEKTMSKLELTIDLLNHIS